MGREKIKVLIIDDSALVRQTFLKIVESDPELLVIGTANDPYVAAQIIAKEIPDVITLDIEMPKMDGLTFLKKLMSQYPIPVIVVSSLTEKGSEAAIKALELGAFDIFAKPRIGTKQFFEESKKMLCDAIKNADKVKFKRRKDFIVEPKLNADAVILKNDNKKLLETTDKIIAIGASTGGTEAIKNFLMAMPYDAPGILIVQHMPEYFTKTFAARLDELCDISVKEASDGDSVINGRALIAPGNYHLLLRRNGAKYFVNIKSGPHVNRHRPSVDVLFRTVAQNAGKNAIGIIMTGMGNDGAQGLLEMKLGGATTLAQDEKSSVVFGMPKEAIKIGAVDHIVSLQNLPGATLKHISYYQNIQK